MHRRDFKAFMAFAALIPVMVFSESVPKQIDVTSTNAMSLGFELVDEGMDDPLDGIEARMVVLKFPSTMHDGWPAIRVQTYLLNQNGAQVASTSSDYEVGSGSPSVLAFYPPSEFDLLFVVHYKKKECASFDCQERYFVPVNEFLDQLPTE